MKATFSIANALKQSWGTLTSQFWILVGLMIAYTIVSLVVSSILSPSDLVNPNWTRQFASAAVSLVIALFFELGYTKNILEALDGEEPQFSAYARQARKIGAALGASLLLFFALVAGCVLLSAAVIALLSRGAAIPSVQDPLAFFTPVNTVCLLLFLVPLIYLYIRVQFYLLFIVEEDAGAIGAITKSWAITKGQEGRLFLLGVVMFGLIVAGILCLLIGVFVTAPLVSIMQGSVFRKLNAPVEAGDAAA